jgi:FtsH-binding integral membrane protein
MKNYKLIPKISLWVLMAIGIACIVLFFAGGSEKVSKAKYYDTGEKVKVEVKADDNAATVATEEQTQVEEGEVEVPNYENEFLLCTYFLLGIAILVTLCAAGATFVNNCKYNPRKAIMSVVVLIAFVGLFVACWYLGSGEKLTIVGYEGDDNEGAWVQMADMVIYACYFLIAATLGAMAWGYVYTKSLK